MFEHIAWTKKQSLDKHGIGCDESDEIILHPIHFVRDLS